MTNTTYQWRVATKCKYSGATSFSTFSTVNQFTTAASFTLMPESFRQDELKPNKTFDAFISPNPTQGTALLAITNSMAENTSVTIADIRGKILWRKNNVADKSIILQLRNLANATYIVTVQQAGNIRTLKLLRQ